MTTGSVAGVTLKTDLSSANMTAQVAAQPAVYAGKLFQQPAGRAKGIREDLQKPKPDLLAELKAKKFSWRNVPNKRPMYRHWISLTTNKKRFCQSK